MSSSPKKPKQASAPPATTATPVTTVPPSGPAVITAINQASALIQQALALIIAFLRGPLTAKQSRAILRARHAGKSVVVSLVKAAAAKPNLAPNGLTAAQLQEQLDLADAYVALATLLTGFNDRVVDTSRLVQADLYKVGLSVYAIAEQNTADPTAQNLVAQMKTALSNGPRNPTRQVTTLPKPTTVTYTDPAAAAAAQAAAEAVTGTAVGAGKGKGKKQPPAAPASSESNTGSTTPATPTPPNVPVYTPAGPAGTAPATNVGTGSTQS
jgi:hypothetical protein